MNSLNPMKSIGAQFKDTLQAHGKSSAQEVRERSAEVLSLVGIDAAHLQSYPHQLSGGMRQRAMIAMALLFTPQLVIMDEPTSALDVVAQQSLMSKVKDLQQKTRVRCRLRNPRHVRGEPLLGSGDGHVRGTGRGGGWDRRDLRAAAAPLQPRLDGLVSLNSRSPPQPQRNPGSPPNLAHPPSGCRFHPRCPEVMATCPTTEPELYNVRGARVRCLLYAEEADHAG